MNHGTEVVTGLVSGIALGLVSIPVLMTFGYMLYLLIAPYDPVLEAQRIIN